MASTKMVFLKPFWVLTAILFLSVHTHAKGKSDMDDNELEDIESEDDIKSNIDAGEVLKLLGPLKTSRVLRTTYYLSKISTDWYSARQHCIDHRLRLVSIEDLEEDGEITQFLNDERVQRIWTSGNDLDRNGQFVWSSTFRSMVYTNWHRLGVPRDPRRNCVFTATDKYWGDGTYGWEEEYCSTRMQFICEETF